MRTHNILILILLTGILMVDVPAQTPSSAYETLAGLVRQTLRANPGVQSAQAALDSATARERADTQALYNPEIELDIDDIGNQSGTVGLSQSIDWNNKRGVRGEAASYERQAMAARLHQARQDLAIELLNGVIQQDVTRRLADLTEEREGLMQQFADLAAQRRDAGDLNQVELDLARLALAEAQLQHSRSTFDLTAARQSLEAVLGDRAVPEIILPDTPPAAAIDNTPDIDELLNNLPTIRTQVARLAAAGKRVKLRRLEKRPDPTVGLRAGQEESGFIAGLSVSVPLYLRNDFSAEVDEANADRMEIELGARDIYRRVRAEMTASLERYRLSSAAWQNWVRTGQESLGSQLTVLERLWRAGEISTTDYLVQINQTLDTRAAATELRGQLWQSWFDWLAASGQVESWLGLTATP